MPGPKKRPVAADRKRVFDFDDTRLAAGFPIVDGNETRMRMRAADEHCVEHARQDYVVDVTAAARSQARQFQAGN